ncbi:unnamed protein product [Rangifer tarandus platyrhynchus]|uniref:Uncharacterized protein n=1 Tax=Rangifer tarandus platyrhynchus TaxID=3082113 RepID=A0AC60A5B2_RANTA
MDTALRERHRIRTRKASAPGCRARGSGARVRMQTFPRPPFQDHRAPSGRQRARPARKEETRCGLGPGGIFPARLGGPGAAEQSPKSRDVRGLLRAHGERGSPGTRVAAMEDLEGPCGRGLASGTLLPADPGP